MAHIERRMVDQRESSGRVRKVARYKIRYRDHAGREHSETKRRLVDAERRKAEIETELAGGTWRDPRRGQVRLSDWAETWVVTRHDLRATTRQRLEVTLRCQVIPKFGQVQLDRITNAAVRVWVAEMLDGGLSAASTRKAVFALRQCLDAAVADNRLAVNPALRVPLPSERAKVPRFLSQDEVERLVEAMPAEYRALVLVGAYAGLRWGEAAGLTRANVDVMRSRIFVRTTAVEVAGTVTLGNEPKTTRSKRTVPVARSVMRRIDEHLATYVGAEADALLFVAPRGGPLFRSFGRQVWHPAVERAGLGDVTFHGLRHSFVAILVAAGCNVREVSEWAGHNRVAFTLTRYGGLFEDGSDAAVDRLDELLSPSTEAHGQVSRLTGRDG
ncbi:integrase [Friedmanniella endophytica]|uniref:Integrase n=1 Tax=Microlunatus kandeliicorticis TaxID=1759536 RepID=A0A7W3INT8_9ACTN|nr:site-specific integrase [Microlunatus kandeliicorticis]MBA8792499.1 integrase [Microlunatus kandeliicorticis]